MRWIENDQVRLLLRPEGAHLYRWEVKAAGSRDLTMPGESDWAGFSDRDLSSDYTARGVYLRLRYKFDADLWAGSNPDINRSLPR